MSNAPRAALFGDVIAHHREQSRSNHCVPACACMIFSWLGLEADEATICQGWSGSRRGYALQDAADVVGGTYHQIDPDLYSFYQWLWLRLREPRWLMAQVFAAPMTRFAAAMQPPLISRFGPLSRGEFGMLHTVVLIGCADQQFFYLDPYYPASRQPFSLTNERFAEAFQGAVVVAPSRDGVLAQQG